MMRLIATALTLSLAGLAPAAAQESEEPVILPVEDVLAEETDPAPPGRLSGIEELVGGLEDAQEPPAPADADPPQPESAEQADAPEPEPAVQAEPEAASPAAPSRQLTEEERDALDRAVARGRDLIAVAQTGLIGTRDMLSRISDPEEAGIAGWLVQPQGNGHALTFYGEGEEGPVAVYRATVLGGRVTAREIFAPGERPLLTPVEAHMAAARAAAAADLGREPCNALPFNIFVLPPSSPDAPVEVYHFTARDARGEFPLGGHFHSVVAPDGTIASSRGFTNSCLELQVDEVPEGERPPAIAVTHLLDPLPTEIHVFMSLWTGRPLIVATGDPQRLWLVTGDRIGEIRE